MANTLSSSTGLRIAEDLSRSAAAIAAFGAIRLLMLTPPSAVRWARSRPVGSEHRTSSALIRRFGDAYQGSELRRRLQGRGNRCVYLPTCTDFAHRAVAKHGLVPGLLLTGDRFRRCNEGGVGSYIDFP